MQNIKPGFYIISTPIGNLADITLRALEILRSSSLILCEDTRVSRKLLSKYNIQAKLKIYNDHSSSNDRERVLEVLKNQKEVISLISDAGTPLIADPGYKLVQAIIKEKYYLEVIPGACSLIAALTISGLPTDRFFFAGFAPRSSNALKMSLAQLFELNCSLIFFETAKRLKKTLLVIDFMNRDCEIAVVNEITKLHQKILRGSAKEIIEDLENNYPNFKGETILLISPLKINKLNNSNQNNNIQEFLDLHKDTKDIKKLLTIASKLFGNFYSKKQIYNMIMHNKKII